MSSVIPGIDLGRNSCSVVGLDEGGAVVRPRRLCRESIVAFAARIDPCTVAMEACCGAHHMAHQPGGGHWRRGA